MKTSQNEVSCDQDGTCGIYLPKNATYKPGELYQLVLYTYSFKILEQYAASPQSFYLFGDSKPSVQSTYKHLFFARGWKIYPPESGFISPDSSELVLKGEGLKHLISLRVRLINEA